MSWTRESLIAAVLALCAPWAVADSITVNTTADDFQANNLCSLREAVDYFNHGKPKGGFQGCVADSVDGNDVITLPANTSPYLIQGKAITIGTALSITGEGRSKPTATTTIEVQGAHRAFIVNNNPQFHAPACGLATPATCASSSTTFDLKPTSDTGVPGDYLTTIRTPLVQGDFGPMVVTPPAVLPGHSWLVRIYDNPKTGDRVQVGQVRVPFSTSSMTWEAVASLNADGVHHLTFTKQEVVTITNEVVGDEGPADPATLKVALIPVPDRKSVRISQLVIKGGCSGVVTGCADAVDDDTDVINPPGAGYDTYGLTYTNGLTGTDGNGGIIFSKEALVLSDVLLQTGQAVDGGAIYVASDGTLDLENSELNQNKADHGAAIYSLSNAASVLRSTLTANTVTATSGAVIEIGSLVLPAGATLTRIISSTISGNDGRALSLRKDGVVNGATVILNGGGVDFNGESVSVYNTILARNTNGGGVDCSNLPATPLFLNNLVLTSGPCPQSGNQAISDTAGTESQLMATLDADGRCTSDFGLLCPLAPVKDGPPAHMPRMLASYIDNLLLVDSSPIINKGSTVDNGVGPSACPAQDQRNLSRTDNVCDIGALEFQQVLPGAVTRTGGTTTYGVPYEQYMDDDLGDERLLPASRCPMADTDPVLGTFPPASIAPDRAVVVANTYSQDVPGCPWIEQAPGRGKVEFLANGKFRYVATSDFHGFDEFRFHVVTTLSNLNALPSDRSRVLRAKVIMEPTSGMTSDKLGGVADEWILGVLLMLWMRGRRGEQA